MASANYLTKYKDINNGINSLVSGEGAKRDQISNDLKVKNNYDDKVKQLNDTNNLLLETEKAFGNVSKNVQTRTKGKLMTNAQEQALISSERQPLAEQLSGISRSSQVGRENISYIDKMIQDSLGLRDRSYRDELSVLQNDRDTNLNLYKDESQKETASLMQRIEAEDRAWEKKMKEDDFNWKKKMDRDDFNLRASKSSKEDSKKSLEQEEFETLYSELTARGDFDKAVELSEFFRANKGNLKGWRYTPQTSTDDLTIDKSNKSKDTRSNWNIFKNNKYTGIDSPITRFLGKEVNKLISSNKKGYSNTYKTK